MYLATLLIVVALLVFYNEIHGKMNAAEYLILAIAFIAIVRAAYNYIKIDSINEGFTSSIKKNKKSKNKNTTEDMIIMNSEDSKIYLDTDEIDNSSNNDLNTNDLNTNDLNTNDLNTKLNDIKNNNKTDSSAINYIDNLLGNEKSNFEDIDKNDIKSIFSPQVIIGKGNNDGNGFGSSGDSSSWNSAFKHDGMSFYNSMGPKKNLWSDDHSFYGDSKQWSKSLESYNKGQWNPNLYKKPSDYVDYKLPSCGTSTPKLSDDDSTQKSNSSTTIDEYGRTTTDEYGQTKKLCGAYDNLDEDQAENLVVRNYTQAKKYFPGYTYIPPVHWDVPQRHISVCRPEGPNVRKLTGLIDRGLPLNVLELNPDGDIAQNEDDVKLTNVGSMMPKFNYQEQPFSKPYV